jgi:hypothetical protein
MAALFARLYGLVAGFFGQAAANLVHRPCGIVSSEQRIAGSGGNGVLSVVRHGPGQVFRAHYEIENLKTGLTDMVDGVFNWPLKCAE